MVMMRTLVELENSHTVGEMMPTHQAGRLELRQHAIYRAEADIVLTGQLPHNVLGRQMPTRLALQEFQDAQSRGGHFQASPA
jgi:hypothetical protein